MNLYFISLGSDMNGENRDQFVRAENLQQAYSIWWDRQNEDLVDEDNHHVLQADWLPDHVFVVAESPAPGILEWHSDDGMKAVWSKKEHEPALLGVGVAPAPKL